MSTRHSIFLLLFLPGFLAAQQTMVQLDPLQSFREAKEHFQQERYSIAYPMFRELQRSMSLPERADLPFTSAEVDFYVTACGLNRGETGAETAALTFLEGERQDALSKKMAYHLAEFYHRRGDHANAVGMYDRTDLNQLSNREISAMKFHQGYSLFMLGRYAQAKPLLNTVRQLTDHPDRWAAHYYFGFIAYSERRYGEALEAFRKVEGHAEFGRAVPFYIANILYNQGRKDEALAYAEANMSRTGGLYASEVNPFMGHAYFERRQFSKALPYLEAAAKGPERVTRGQLYELSYAYYETGRYDRAAEGFSQLSEGSDSLTQSAMYLLGDAYLRLGRKADARSAFSYCAANSSVAHQREVAAFHYAKLSHELGYQDIALAELRKFVARYPASAYAREARESMVLLLANTNNYREALALLDGMSAPSESSRQLLPRIVYGRAMELVNDQDLRQAEQLLDRVLRDPRRGVYESPSRFWKGEIAYRTGRYDESVRALAEYASTPGTPMGEANLLHGRYTLGYAHLRREEYRDAQRQFEQVARNPRQGSTPVEMDAYLRQADCHYMLREYPKARGMYEKAIELSWPASDHASFQTAMIAGITSPAEKIRILSAFERKYPVSVLVPQANMEVAATHLSEERYREAIPFLDKVLAGGPAAAPLQARAYLRLGIAYFNLNDNRRALENYQQVVRRHGGSPEADEAVESVRAIYVEEGRTAEYAEFLRANGRNISRSEEDSLAWSVAEARTAEGDKPGALAAINDYLRRFPDGDFSHEAGYFRAEILEGRKEWRAAVEDYARVAESGGRYAEKAMRQAARISFFELKDYAAAEQGFSRLKSVTANREYRLDAMRGLLRSQYQLGRWSEAVPNAQELLKEASASTDDRVLAAMVLGKSAQAAGRHADAIQQFRAVVGLNNAAYAAEARYGIADAHFRLNDLRNAEKAALDAINKSGSYDYWITRSYILLGEVFWKQKDFFNAKATLQSVVENSRNEELKEEAAVKLEMVKEEERKNSKVGDGRP